VDADLQGVCKAFDIVDRDVPHLAFDMRHEGSVKACLQSQVLLGPPLLPSESNDIDRKEFPRFWDT